VQRRFRLTRSNDFKRVRRYGKSYAHPLVVLMVLASDSTQTRVGVAAGRTVGNAVRRNRAKRLLRAAVQPLLADLAPGWDLVLIARPPLLDASMLQVRTAISTLMKKAQVLAPVNES
jgi:ribonuclease P protein component